jgi:hypothetical protein
MQRLDEIATTLRVEKGELLLRKGSFPAAL